MPINFEVNGKPVSVDVEARTTLADCLRHHLRLTGTHVGCEHGVCGACTVIVDGDAVRSCLMLAVQAEGTKVVTVEGLSQRRGADAAAGVVPQAPRAAMRLLHARHDHHRARAADRGARLRRRPRARGAVRQSLPLHRLHLDRRGGARRARGLSRSRGAMKQRLHRQPGRAREDLRFLRGRGEYVDDSEARRAALCRDPAQLGRARPHPSRSTRRAALKMPGVHAVITAKDMPAGAADRADAAAAAAGVQAVRAAGDRARQGALCRRADGGGARRQRRDRRGRARGDRGRDRAAAGGRRLACAARDESAAVRGARHQPLADFNAVHGDADAAFANAPYVRRETLPRQPPLRR